MPTPRKVLLLGSRKDADFARECWQNSYDYVACEPSDAAPDFAIEQHFEFVLSSGLPEQRELEAAVGARFPLIVLLEADDNSAFERSHAGAFVVIRGASAALQLQQGVRYCAEKTAKESFISAVEGPLIHDLRGIVGIVYLSARLLEGASQEAGPNTSHEKSLNACRRITWWLSDLEAHLALRLEPERLWQRVQGTNWHDVLSCRVAELALDHPWRALTLTVASRPKCTLSPAHVLLVLRGIFEVALKTTGSTEAVHLTIDGEADEALSLTITAEHSSRSPAIDEALRAGPSHWPSGPGSDIPFHLVSASLLARATGGELSIAWLGERLQAVARWPAAPALALA